MIRVLSATSWETLSANHLRKLAWTSSACSGVATLPVPLVGNAIVSRSPALDRILVPKDSHGPDGFICNNNVGPVLDLVGNGLELTSDDFGGLASLAFLELFTNASNDADTGVQGVSSLFTDELANARQYI